MKSPLRILYLEDDPRDADLVQETLAGDGIDSEMVRVETEAEFAAALGAGGFDLILADYTLPTFDGISALKIARKNWPQVPFIFVSGTLGEEVAIEALKIGATDYVFKTRLLRIAPSVLRALREAEERTGLTHAEEALRRSEAYLAEAQKLSRTGSFGWDISNGEIYWSRETFRIFGYDPTIKPTVEHMAQRTHPEDKEAVRQFIERVSRERKEWDLEHRLLMPDGSVKFVRSVGRPSTDESGRFEFVGAITDVTERKRGEEALRESERSLRLMVDSIPGLTCTMTAQGEVELVNQRIVEYTGLTPEEFKNWPLLVHPDDLSGVAKTWRRSVETGRPYDIEHRIRGADGIFRWFHVRGLPGRDSEGRILRWYVLISDIDERKKGEEKLRASEADLLEAQRLAHTGSWKHEVASGRVIVSPEIYRIFGLNPEADTFTAEQWFERIHPEDRKRTQEIFARCEFEKINYEAEYRIIHPDGTIKYQHAIGHPILNESGGLVEFGGTAMDVTEEVEARTALQMAFAEIKLLRDQLYKENIALREEIDRSLMFEEIVGGSPALQSVLARVAKVAPTDSTVLITGETGTGKELFARAIHQRSRRSSRAFVGVNCAATPATLIASELFGHEKGAFTGALQRRLGRFEYAEGGTIFLDEIGELPAETQIALLRILQEREFERVGGSQTIQADVRVVAATNRNLEGAIVEGAFRRDLFYRLNVFPIEIPPLRERKEDIPTLIEYFVQRYSRKIGKKIRTIEKRTLELLQSYSWPGNVRELQNVIERSVIFCETELFSVDPSWLSFESSALPADGSAPARMSPVKERESIEKALAASAGRVSGPSGAAAQLGMPASTLESKIRSLKINKFRFKQA